MSEKKHELQKQSAQYQQKYIEEQRKLFEAHKKDKDICFTCKYFSGLEYGTCRIKPPKIFLIRTAEYRKVSHTLLNIRVDERTNKPHWETKYPEVCYTDEKCGEHWYEEKNTCETSQEY